MTSLMSRMITGCGNATYNVCECCHYSLGNGIRGIRRMRVRKMGQSLANGTRRMYVRVVHFVRSRLGSSCVQKTSLEEVLAPLRDPEDGSEQVREPKNTTSTPPKPRHHHHQPLKEINTPVDFFAKCRPQSELPCELLLSTWTTQDEGQGRGGKGTGGGGGGGGGTRAQSTGHPFHLPESFSVKELEQYLVCTMHSPSLDLQLQSIPREEAGRSKTVATMTANTKKNRYKNNIPYDDTRVVLEGEEGADYINASYVQGVEGPRDFIATQGPKEGLERTLDAFWRMVWQSGANVIVMLGNLTEGGRAKVSQYWPNPRGVRQSYGQVEVEKKTEKVDINWVRRHFIVSLGTKSREVIQYQFTAWPDHDVPGSPYGAARLVKDMLRWQWTGPPVIHCSAGLGRTGTCLLVLRLLDDLRHKGRFQPLSTLQALRRCRPNLLDNQFQYRFAHYVLLEVLFGSKTRLPLYRGCAVTNSLRNQLPDQFKELKRVPNRLTCHGASTQDLALNRDNAVLPPDGRQVFALAGGTTREYVNAVRVRGSTLRDAFVVTEHPMCHTISRCWRLAYTTKALAWIHLHDHKPNDQSFPSVLPSGDYGELDGVTVRITGKAERQFFTERSVSINVSEGEPHLMRLIHLKNWSPVSELPNPLESLIFLAKHVQQIRRSTPLRLVMVTCSDGYSGSGVFVALFRMMTEVRLTQSVDVFRTVQSVLFDRPHFIISQKQYFYLHDASLIYYKQQKNENKKIREQVNQTQGNQPGKLEQERAKQTQPSEDKERKPENITRERATTGNPKEVKAGESVQDARGLAGAVGRARETCERREIQGQGKGNPDPVRPKAKGTRVRGANTNTYENVWGENVLPLPPKRRSNESRNE